MKPTYVANKLSFVAPIIIEESGSNSDELSPSCILTPRDAEIVATTPITPEICNIESYDNIAQLTSLSYCSSTITTDDEMDDLPFLDLLVGLSNTSEDLFLADSGYIDKQYISNTLQGQLYKAYSVHDQSKRVIIKKTDKELHEERITIQNGISFITDENIVNEACILRDLTTQKCPNTIPKYVNFFESETHFYLVTEYIDNTITLKDFIQKCHTYISKNTLTLNKYNKIIKRIFLEISLTLHWLHNSTHHAHLNLCSENILLSNAFIMNKNGKMCLNENLCVTISEFGCSERFENNIFKCNKYALSIDNEQYLAPNITNQSYYDARLCDTWSLGMILYEALIGTQPFDMLPDIDNIITSENGYWAIYKEKIDIYLRVNNLMRYINKKDNTLMLLKGLLKINENERFDTNQIINHYWLRK